MSTTKPGYTNPQTAGWDVQDAYTEQVAPTLPFANVLILRTADAIPAGTPVNTLIARY